MQLSQRGDRGAHGGAGGEAVVDEDDDFVMELGRRAVVTVEALAALELLALTGGDLVDERAWDAEAVDDVAIQNLDPAGGDRAHGELLMAGHAQLADDEHVERSVEGLGDFQGNGYSPARQSEHLNIR